MSQAITREEIEAAYPMWISMPLQVLRDRLEAQGIAMAIALGANPCAVHVLAKARELADVTIKGIEAERELCAQPSWTEQAVWEKG